MNLLQRHTHSDRLENWLGSARVEAISASMKNWYGPPIAMQGVPGNVHAARGGDFIGPIDAGRHTALLDFVHDKSNRAFKRWSARQQRMAGAGFASLGDLIAEATGGKRRIYPYLKTGITGVANACSTLWTAAGQPSVGASAGAAPGGTIPVDSDAGSFLFSNPTGGDTQHLTRWDGYSSVQANTLLLYDRIFMVTKTMSNSGTEAVTGVPTRYTSITGGAADSAEGNFLFIESRTTLSATAHNWTAVQYTDQSGNTASALPSVTGISGCIASRLDMPVGQWFAPLAAGDSGLTALTQMQCSSNAVTGAIDFVIGHPLAFFNFPGAGQFFYLGMINDAFNLTRVFDDAAMAFLEVIKPNTTATSYSGMFETVSG